MLKPWTSLQQLKRQDQTFDNSWVDFTPSLSNTDQIFVANINYYHECSDSAKAHRQEESEEGFGKDNGLQEEYNEGVAMMVDDLLDDHMDISLTEADVTEARQQKHNARDQLLGTTALSIAEGLNMFNVDQVGDVLPKSVAITATQEMLDTINAWDRTLKTTHQKKSNTVTN